VTDYATAVQALSGLVGYWRLADTSGATAVATVGDNGTYANILYSRTGLLTGDSDKAIGFDVDTQPAGLLTIPITNIPVGASARTTKLWFKTANWRMAGLLSYGFNNNQNDAWGIVINPTQGNPDNKIKVYTWADDHTWSGITPDAGDNTVHMVAVTYDGGNPGTIALYYDGVHQSGDFTPAAQLHTQSNFPLTIGNNAWLGANAWEYTVDELAVWNRNLSASEISGLYSVGTNPSGPGVHTWNVV
jgi:Concanavalin A-like lectin/glucanases superfamily